MNIPQHARDQAVGLPRESAPKKAKVGLSANKVMATIFWDARGVIYTDYLQKVRTIDGEYYTNLLDRFNENLKKKTTAFGQEKSYFSSRQCKSTCVCCFHGEISRITL